MARPTKADREDAKDDLEDYYKAMMKNDIGEALSIEKRYCLYGYPPDIVSFALQAIIDGKDMYKALDRKFSGK